MQLTRYWFKFHLVFSDEQPPGVLMGCGITAISQEDAIQILKQRVFSGFPFPNISTVVPDIDISTLDEKHVLPNMVNPAARGVWFPLGFL